MSKIHFRETLRKYLSGECSDKEKRIVEQWYQLLDNPERFNNYSEENLNLLEAELWGKIKTRTVAPPARISKKAYIWATAASIAVFLVSGLYIFMNRSASPVFLQREVLSEKNLIVRKNNDKSRNLKVALPDNSAILLEPGSEIRYPEKFEALERNVYLSGNAFFEVTPDPQKPFKVYTGDLITKVLGTSFWIKNDRKMNIEVSVITGKVTVFKKEGNAGSNDPKIKDGVIITANQKATYHIENMLFTTDLITQPKPIAEKVAEGFDTDMKFYDASLTEVFKKIENAYGLEIILENENVGNCPFTGDLRKLDLFPRLDIICASLHLAYEVRGTKILINGNGCQ
jgi:transmembrane sensor